MPIVFACFSPHPPIILPNVGSPEDRAQVEKTIESLEKLGEKLKKSEPDLIIISAPHTNWGFDVPLYFLARRFVRRLVRGSPGEGGSPSESGSPGEGGTDKDFKGEIKKILIGAETAESYFNQGKEIYTKYDMQNTKYKVALIASGDTSHCLKENGPYGHHPDGPKFDISLINFLKRKETKNILKLDEMYPEAAECGLRSFCFLLGALEASEQVWQPEILSYEGPFGVGYLVANFRL